MENSAGIPQTDHVEVENCFAWQAVIAGKPAPTVIAGVHKICAHS
jgi:hypothetical protein